MKENQIVKVENVEDKIYMIRGQRVMFDSDLAEVYGVSTSRLNEQVKRNKHRFPEDFIFQMTIEEFTNLSQIATGFKHRDPKKLPYVFTEHGAVMLASVLNSPKAIDASIQVVRAFVRLRSILTEHKELAQKIEEIEKQFATHDNQFDEIFLHLNEIFQRLPNLEADVKPMRKIGFVEEDKKKI